MRRLAWLPIVTLVMVLAQACTARPPAVASGPPLPPPEAGVLRTAAGEHRLGTLVVDREITVAAGGTVREVRRLIATGGFARLYEREAAAVEAGRRTGWQVTAGPEEGRYVVTMVKEYRDFAAFNRENMGTLERVGHPLYQIISFQDRLAAGAEDLAALYPPPAGATPEEFRRFLGAAIHFTYRVTLPSAVTGASAGATVAGNTVTWRWTAAEVGAGVEVSARAKVFRPWPLLATLGAMGLVVGLVLLIREYGERERRGEVPADPPPGAAGGPGTPAAGGRGDTA